MRAISLVASSLLIIGLAQPAFAWPFSGDSSTLIPPSQTFLLGGDQDSAFVVKGCNTGLVAVEVSSQTKQSSRFIVLLKPKACLEHRFEAGDMATFRNTSDSRQATLKIELNRDVRGLSMRYYDKKR